jgi:hypothetical protein
LRSPTLTPAPLAPPPQHFDRDGDGVISADDLAAALRSDAALAAAAPAGPADTSPAGAAAGSPEEEEADAVTAAPSDAEVAAMLAEADEDGDGCLDWKEVRGPEARLSQRAWLAAMRLESRAQQLQLSTVAPLQLALSTTRPTPNPNPPSSST